MAKHDIVVLNSTSSGFETDLGNNTARIKGDANEVFSVRNASEVSKFSVDTTNASVTFTTNITSSGHVTSSVGSTGSFGRVDVTKISGDASLMTNVNEIGHISTSAQLATAISGAFNAGFTTTGDISGSSTSTGSFGYIYSPTYSGDASLMTNVNEDGHFSGSAQMASNISGSHTSGFELEGTISGSATSTGSFGRVVWGGNIGVTDASAVTGITSLYPTGTVSGSAQLATAISGSHTSGFEFASGNISGSATSTGSFGRIDFIGTGLSGNASQMTNVPVDTGTLSGSGQIATQISGSFNKGFSYGGEISGSATSTGSFGNLTATTFNVTNLDLTGSAIQRESVLITGSAQLATAISGSHTSGFEFTGTISGSATSTGSFTRIEATKFVGDGAAIDVSSAYSGMISSSAQLASQISGSFNKGFSYGGEISGSVTSTGSFGQFYSDKYVGDATAVAGMTGLTEPEGALSSSVQIADQVSGSFRQGFTFSGLISGSLTSTGSLGRVNVDTIYANSFKDVIISTGVNSGSNALKYNAKDLATEISGAFESGFNLKSGKMISGSVTSTGSFGEIRASVVSTVNMTTGLRKPVSGSMDHVSYTSGSFNTRRSNKPFRIPIFGRGHDISTQQFTATGSMQSQKYRSQAGQLFINNFGQLGITIQTGSLGPVAGTWTEGPDYPGNARGPGAVGTPNAAMMVGGQSLTSSAQYDGISWSGTVDSTHRRDSGANNKSVGSVDAAVFIGHTGGQGNFSAPGFSGVPNFSDFFETWDGVSFQRCTTTLSPYSARFGAAAKGGSANSHIVFGGDYAEYGWPRTSCWNGVTWQAASYAINNDREYGAGFGGVHDAVYAGGAAPLNDCTEEWNGATWATATALPTVQQAGGGMGATQNAGLIAGGSTTTLVQEYNGTTWSEQSALPTGTNEHGTAGSAAAGFVLAGLSGADAFQQWTGGFVSGSVESTTVQACGYNNFSQNPTGRYLLTKRIEGSLSPSHVQTSGITSGSNTLSDGLTQGKGFGGGY